MAIDYGKLKTWPFRDIEQTLTRKDTMLYALGLGLGADPTDRDQLRFVYEEGLLALPTMAVVMGYPGFWVKDPATGVDWKKVLHGEQGLQLHRPLPVEGRIVGRMRVDEIIDKGVQKGAFMYSTREVFDAATGDKLATLTQTTVMRGDGGFGGPNLPVPEPHAIPDRSPDHTVRLPTLPQAALIYRLSGDFNPLHADPEIARTAGFPRPILHGLCTFGVAGHALLKQLCGYAPARLRRIDARFSSPVFPGETIVTEIWREQEGRYAFRCKAAERDLVVLNNGLCEVGPP